MRRQNIQNPLLLLGIGAILGAVVTHRNGANDRPVLSPPPQGAGGEHAWHRHPMLISSLTICLGGFGLFLLQSGVEQKRALIAKRMEVAEQVVEYRSLTNSFLRSVNVFFCQIRRGKISVQDLAAKEVESQKLMNAAFQHEELLQARLYLYFPLPSGQMNQSSTPLLQFEKWTELFHQYVNVVYSKQTSCTPDTIAPYFDESLKAQVNTLNAVSPYIPLQRIKLIERPEAQPSNQAFMPTRVDSKDGAQ